MLRIRPEIKNTTAKLQGFLNPRHLQHTHRTKSKNIHSHLQSELQTPLKQYPSSRPKSSLLHVPNKLTVGFSHQTIKYNPQHSERNG
jgi:hypothetical protein